MVNHLGLSNIEKAKNFIEKLLNSKLEEGYNSREDDNEDEEFGHHIDFEHNMGPEMESLIVQIFEDGKVQLWHDASPYPVAVNTAEEVRMMSMALCHSPVPFEKVTAEDLQKTINRIKENC